MARTMATAAHTQDPPCSQIDIRAAPHSSSGSSQAVSQATAAAPAAFPVPQAVANPSMGLSQEQVQCCQQLVVQCPGSTLELAARCLAESQWQLPIAVPFMQQYLARQGGAAGGGMAAGLQF